MRAGLTASPGADELMRFEVEFGFKNTMGFDRGLLFPFLLCVSGDSLSVLGAFEMFKNEMGKTGNSLRW